VIVRSAVTELKPGLNVPAHHAADKHDTPSSHLKLTPDQLALDPLDLKW